jgi:hypothetical protein
MTPSVINPDSQLNTNKKGVSETYTVKLLHDD